MMYKNPNFETERDDWKAKCIADPQLVNTKEFQVWCIANTDDMMTWGKAVAEAHYAEQTKNAPWRQGDGS